MLRINDHYLRLPPGYLFPEILRRREEFEKRHPDATVIRLGIGDIALPIVPAVIEALRAAVETMGDPEHFRGYGPEAGYDFLRAAIADVDYGRRGIQIAPDEIFVSDGSKQDCANIQELLDPACRIAVPDPVYPVYVDTNVMAGRGGPADRRGHYEGILYLPATPANDFFPEPPAAAADVAYLCSPNNPTGSVATRQRLRDWVDWAREREALLVFDAAYDAFIQDDTLPRSIYEIPGAETCAVEMRSFSKRAGFTGLRCAYTVVPKALTGHSASGEQISLHRLWSRRQDTKFNGVPYPVQRAAEAALSPEGLRQTGEQVAYYRENARLLREGLAAAGVHSFGGVHAPYLWVEVPGGGSSWSFFDQLLERAHIVVTPGVGFGPAGEGYVRVSALARREHVETALERLGRGLGH